MDATHDRRETTHFSISVKEKAMNTRYLLTLCTVLVIGGALIAGSAHAVNTADEKTPITDTGLTAKTKIALVADARVKGSEINVETSQGSVMIRGKVHSDEAKQAAEGCTKGIDGVKTVKNEVQVVAPSKREAIDDKDASITIRVNAQFAKDSALKDAGIHTQTNAGVVSLNGDVSSLMTSDHAFWVVWQVPGVKWVKNGLTVKETAKDLTSKTLSFPSVDIRSS
jgi:hyperosmotically inducible protein